ncbi:Peroxisomal membrane protein (Pex16) [Popillia japonica]|uniref:Peroxisomal membrane protein PEX16 n=1 Tax=Popillia japonica TaxID=7064 RepID=A0AAW1HTK1_POPJA
MSTLLFSLPDLFEKYKNWIVRNPEKANDFETTAKWISYFIAGRINNSHAVSELVYALSNLLVLFNDRLITKGRQLEKNEDTSKLKIWLTVLEYSEVFLEISSSKVFGNRGKWLVIISIQIIKCIARLILVYRYKEPIITVLKINIL